MDNGKLSTVAIVAAAWSAVCVLVLLAICLTTNATPDELLGTTLYAQTRSPTRPTPKRTGVVIQAPDGSLAYGIINEMLVVSVCALAACVFALAALALTLLVYNARAGSTKAGGAKKGAGAAGAAGVGSDGLASVSTGKDLVISANGIRLVLARRLAGGVWSMTWNGQEFVSPEMGNGGSQQSAMSFDIPVGHSSEEENPTEAGQGGYHDGGSTSQWLAAKTNGREAYTQARIGYYVEPGTWIQQPVRAKARGKGPVSDVTLTKRVSIGYKGFTNVVNYALNFDVPTAHWFIQFEFLCGHMPRAFQTIYYMEGDKAVPVKARIYSPEAGKPLKHIIMAKDDTCALGVFCYKWPSNGRFKYPWYLVDTVNPAGNFPWDKGQYPAGVTSPISKWNVVWHAGAQDVPSDKTHQGSYAFGVALVLGSLRTVVGTMAALARS